MTNLSILEVAIGIVFVYLLLALICTTVNEAIMTQLRSRAKFLDQGILALLGSSEAKREFFSQPLIRSFIHPKGDSVLRKTARKLGAKTATADHCPSYLSGFAFAKAVHDMTKDPNTGRIVGTPRIGENHLSEAVHAIVADAQDPGDELRVLERWYDDEMDRVSGWYKRHAQAWVRFLAVVITLLMNADTIQITKKLWLDPTLRAAVVDAAKARSQKPPKAMAASYSEEDSAIPEETADQFGTETTQEVGTTQALTDDERQLLGNLVGWDDDQKLYCALLEENDALPEVPEPPNPVDPKVAYRKSGVAISAMFSWQLVKTHWLGWLLTMIAVSLGAPFWFDVLNKFMNIRNAGRAPDEPRDKSSKKKEREDAA